MLKSEINHFVNQIENVKAEMIKFDEHFQVALEDEDYKLGWLIAEL